LVKKVTLKRKGKLKGQPGQNRSLETCGKTLEIVETTGILFSDTLQANFIQEL
jgi:hypothetical protein